MRSKAGNLNATCRKRKQPCLKNAGCAQSLELIRLPRGFVPLMSLTAGIAAISPSHVNVPATKHCHHLKAFGRKEKNNSKCRPSCELLVTLKHPNCYSLSTSLFFQKASRQ